MGRVISQIKCLLWKNVLLKRRNKKQLLSEFLMPIYFICLLAVVKAVISPEIQPEVASFQSHAINDQQVFPRASSHILVAPNTWDIAYIMEMVVYDMNVTYTMFGSQADAERFYLEHPEPKYLGVIFHYDNGYLSYAIRTPYSSAPNPESFLNLRSGGCRTEDGDCSANDYLRSGFAALQVAINTAIIRNQTRLPLLPLPDVSVRLFPKPVYTPDTSYIQMISAIFFVVAYSPFINFLVVNLVTEKERQIKEGMRVMGMRDSAFWISWSVIYAAIIIIVTCVIIAIAALSDFFANSNMFIFFLMLLLYGLTIINLSFLVTPFFNKALSAGFLACFATMAISCLYLLVSMTRSYTNTGEVDHSVTPGGRWALSLLSPVALALAIDQGIFLDIRYGGMTFETISIGDFPLYAPIIMLAVDTVLYGALAVYFDNVIPSAHGQTRPPWYIFLPSYWCGKSHRDRSRFNTTYLPSNMHPQKYDDVEPVPSDLHGKEGIRLINLRKVYKGQEEDVIAVDGLSLDMYEGQITGLLGHNGAGKTTLINMLTGLTPATSGTGTVLGLEIGDPNSMDEIRGNCGVCTQHDILFDRLSPREHLRIYAGIKNIPANQTDDAIEQSLADVELVDHGNTLAEELSGGQKRKLSLAIALIGDPKVIFLDEPTTGMDPFSRRQVWALLQKRKKGKLILLTTHSMDEADILTDRKVILSKGRLHCCGSSLFLKNRFGIGYHLNLVVNSSCDPIKIRGLIKQYINDVGMSRSHGNELSYTLPMSEVNSFPALFSSLEKSDTDNKSAADSLGIESFGVSMTTLEEVFLKLGENDEKVEENADSETKANVSDAHPCATPVEPSKSQNMTELSPIQESSAASKRNLWNQRFWALWKIRYLAVIRSKLALIFQLLLPVVFVVIGCLVNKFASPRSNSASPPSLNMETALGAYLRSRNSSATSRVAAPLIFQDESDSSFAYILKMGLETFIHIDTSNSSVNLLDVQPHNLGINFTTLEPVTQGYDLSCTVLYNDTAIHSLPAVIDLLLNGLYGLINMGAPPNRVQTYNLPWNNTEVTLEFNNGAFSGSILIALAFVLIPTGFAVFIVRERQWKVRSQLRVSGVTWGVYWGTTFLFNMAQFCIPAVLCIIVVLAAQVESLMYVGAILSLVILFILYMVVGTLLSYCLSFLFKTSDTCQSVLPNIFLHVSMIPYVVVAMLDQFDNSDMASILHYIFCVFDPCYLIFGGVYYIGRIHRIKSLTIAEVTVGDYFIWNSKLPIVYIMAVVHCVALFFLLRLLEVRTTGGDPSDILKCSSAARGCHAAPDTNGDMIEMEDLDVAKERRYVDNLEHNNKNEVPVVVVKNLRKEFRSREKLKGEKKRQFCLRSTQEEIKVAVRNSTFCVPPGEVFGLLGPNGAGKTTTINMIIAEEGMTNGQIEVSGYNVRSSLSGVVQALGACPQHDALWEDITLREHLHCYAAIRGISPTEIPSTANCLMESLKVEEHADKHANKLSGGTKRKLSYAMSMLGNPRVVLLDEPSTGMDPQSKRFLWDTISSSFKGKDRGAILTTHYMEEADALCSRVAIMVNGQIQCLGSTQHLKNKFGSGYILEVKISQGRPFSAVVERAAEDMEGVSTPAGRMEQFEEYVKKLFPNVVCAEKFGDRALFKIPKDDIVSLGQTFAALEEAKLLYSVNEYSLTQPTLEQVFLTFAKKQLDDGEDSEESILRHSTKPGVSDVCV